MPNERKRMQLHIVKKLSFASACILFCLTPASPQSLDTDTHAHTRFVETDPAALWYVLRHASADLWLLVEVATVSGYTETNCNPAFTVDQALSYPVCCFCSWSSESWPL